MLLQVYGTFLTGLTVADILEYKMLDYNTDVKSPVDTVSIIIPSLNEERFIEQCLVSLRNQSMYINYSDNFEYILVDGGSNDNTIKLAEPYVDKIIKSPKGKLTQRNLATKYSRNNIIVSVDSDMIYPQQWLNTILEPFNNPRIVGVSGSILDNNIAYVPKPLYILSTIFDRTIMHPYRMMGGNSAYWKHLFYLTGEFNTNINQKDGKQMIKEEEIDFGKRLSNYGNVIYKHNATGIHLGGERTSCRLGLKSGKVCNNYKIGIERFG